MRSKSLEKWRKELVGNFEEEEKKFLKLVE